jgi:hypothetical protein
LKDFLNHFVHVFENEDQGILCNLQTSKTKIRINTLTIILSLKSSYSSISLIPLSPNHRSELGSCLSIDSDHLCHLILLIEFCSNFLLGFFPFDVCTHPILPSSVIDKSVPLGDSLLAFSNPQAERTRTSIHFA